MTRGPDPIALMKAVKNPVEIEGAREAHLRDGAAVTRFLAWLDREAPDGELTEIDAVEALESFRRDTGLLKDVSFPTIAGAGPDGAIVHYRVTRVDQPPDLARRTVPDRFRRPIRGRHHRHHPHRRGRRADRRDARALHAGAQGPYRDRARGVPRRHHRRAARSVRAAGAVGAPASTSTTAPATASAAICRCTKARRASPSSATRALKRGMILSNEPGYYKAGDYGIRIENLVLVVEAPTVAGGEKPLNAFETLTLAPIDRRLIERRCSTLDEIAWLDAYHARVARGADAAGRCRDAALARGRDPAARPGLRRRAWTTSPPSSCTTIRAPHRSDAKPWGLLLLLMAMTVHRPDHAQHRGAGAAADGEPSRLRRRHHPAHRLGLSAGARRGPARDGAAVRPLRPAAGAARGRWRSPPARACWRSSCRRSAA